MLFSEGSIWIAGHHSSALLRVDPTTGQAQATIGIGYQAQIPFEAAGLIWVPSPLLLVAIDPATNTIVHQISGTFSLNGAFAAGKVWVGNGQDALLEIDPATGKTIKTMQAPTPHVEDCLNPVVFANGALWWSVQDNSLVERIDPANAKVQATFDHVGGTFVTQVGSDVWITGNSGMAHLVDDATNTIATTIPFSGPGGGNCPGTTAAIGDTLFVVDDTTFNAVFGLNTREGTVVHYDPGDVDIQDITASDSSVWVCFWDSGSVGRYDMPAPTP